MWRRLLWWTTPRPAVLPWAVLLSILLLLLGDSARRGISGTVVDYAYAPLFSLKYRIAAATRVFDENRDLRRQIMELSLENQRLRENAVENTRLRGLLTLSPFWRAQAVPAEVVAPISPRSGVMWIKTGDTAAVAVGWPVATERGLVGKIVDVRGRLARVRTLWDRVSRVAAYDQRSRAPGIIAWKEETKLSLTYVRPRTDVQTGDSIISSGWGEVFPKGLRIGTVESVDTTEDNTFLEVTVRPETVPDLLEHVFVIRPLPADVSTREPQP